MTYPVRSIGSTNISGNFQQIELSSASLREVDVGGSGGMHWAAPSAATCPEGSEALLPRELPTERSIAIRVADRHAQRLRQRSGADISFIRGEQSLQILAAADRQQPESCVNAPALAKEVGENLFVSGLINGIGTSLMVGLLHIPPSIPVIGIFAVVGTVIPMAYGRIKACATGS